MFAGQRSEGTSGNAGVGTGAGTAVSGVPPEGHLARQLRSRAGPQHRDRLAELTAAAARGRTVERRTERATTDAASGDEGGGAPGNAARWQGCRYAGIEQNPQ